MKQNNDVANLKGIMVFAGNVRSLVANRGDLIKYWASLGHRIKAIVPAYDWNDSIERLPLEWETIDLRRASLNPLADLAAFKAIRRSINAWRPDTIFSYTAKPVLYGSLAAAKEGVPNIFSMITGLGYARTGRGLKQKLALSVQNQLYRRALRVNTAVFFQNPDDEQLFLKEKLISTSAKRCITNGSGVNLERFPLSWPPPEKPIVFLMIARLLYDKGVTEFVAAARELARPGLRFVLVGPHDPNLPAAITQDQLDNWKSNGAVEFVGGVSDVRPYIRESTVFVLPSYREGTPRSVLEAMSMGRPIITTDAPGCRETVDDGINGFLVPVGDHMALANAIKRFVDQPPLIQEMGMASRRIAEEKYDVKKVNAMITEVMGLDKHVI